MVFSSLTMLFLFLPITFSAVYICPKKLKNAAILLFSLLFYLVGEPRFFILLPFCALWSYLFGLALSSEKRSAKSKKIILALSVIGGLFPLFFFKYTDFFIKSANSLLGISLPLTGISLPVGISFYTFQSVSYNIDIYRGNAKAEKNIISYAAYLCLFPQLVAGPIVRYSDIAEQLPDRKANLSDLSYGILRFAAGLSKKVILADSFGLLCTAYADSASKSALFAWISAISYTLRIYFDFSGYSDMAIGLGRMLGFVFPENFDYPYTAHSISEFWRRWHITLSSWFRDYVYIPLGGNRRGKLRTVLNLAAVWALTGLWHGADYTFVIWGLMYGLLIAAEKTFSGGFFERHRHIGRIYTLFFTVIGFVIFSADGIGAAVKMFSEMVCVNLPFCTAETLYYLKSFLPLLIIGAVGSTPAVKKLFGKLPEIVRNIAVPILTAVGLIISTAYLVDGSFNPFLYFRF